ncbi:hypothetical protein PY25_003184 [Salmonella enterica subsp. enterica]|uniref:Uncharacterized protein n=1 Tax=Salmonella enterica TaxID=28901 RepID=A0A742PLD5_SALER|nr:hypothetical protein [Salmonella enterica subsp. enterica]EDQ8068984.1 hypothetical protein [Salmonella enterica subsp. enterica serovar Monschaui]EDR4765624.1 hypothetical protein [Salmonella enterica subsp. enterica serovar Bergen]EDS2562024.1 hypothetical protein [Salmonella enterica]EDU4074108.1 hypothetical protein [Salmonella enterica subsp. enterica serovar Hadar]
MIQTVISPSGVQLYRCKQYLKTCQHSHHNNGALHHTIIDMTMITCSAMF